MQVQHCENCGKLIGYKRNLGFGTIIMIVITFGLWILVLPFYPVRCSACGISRGDNNKIQGFNTISTGGWIFIVIILLSLMGRCST